VAKQKSRAEYNKKWRAEHPDKCKQYHKTYYDNNKEKCNASSRLYREEHKDELNKNHREVYWPEYYKNNKGKIYEYQKGYHEEHKEESVEYQHQWYLDNREEVLKRNKQHNIDKADEISKQKSNRNQGWRVEVLTHYGNGKLACVKCGFSDIRGLSLDHIDGKGSIERERIGDRGVNLYGYLKNHGYPEWYQTLCMNCQNIKKIENKEQPRVHDAPSLPVSYLINRITVLTHYGNEKCSCVKCGFSDIRALSIDHINGDGANHRKEVRSSNLYRWLIQNNYPEGFQTLCMNCQSIKRYENNEHNDKTKSKNGKTLN